MPKFKVDERVERTRVGASWMEFPAYGTVIAITGNRYTVKYDSEINGTEKDISERDLRSIEQHNARLDQ